MSNCVKKKYTLIEYAIKKYILFLLLLLIRYNKTFSGEFDVFSAFLILLDTHYFLFLEWWRKQEHPKKKHQPSESKMTNSLSNQDPPEWVLNRDGERYSVIHKLTLWKTGR